MIVADLSFISIITILKKVKEIIEYPLDLYILLKPQFEAGKEIMDKCRGVIKDEKIRENIRENSQKQIEEQGFAILDSIESPIKGSKGNVEYLLWLQKDK